MTINNHFQTKNDYMVCLCNKCTAKECIMKRTLKKRVLGKRNRNTGRYAEQKLLKLFQSWNIKIHQTIASGSLKQVTSRLTETNKDLFVSDFYTTDLIKGETIRIENKKRQFNVFKKYYYKTDLNTVLYIKDFCYIVSQNSFKRILDKDFSQVVLIEEDKNNKLLHKFFNQDNAQIVSLISTDELSNRYRDFLFCFNVKTYKKFIEQRKR